MAFSTYYLISLMKYFFKKVLVVFSMNMLGFSFRDSVTVFENFYGTFPKAWKIF